MTNVKFSEFSDYDPSGGAVSGAGVQDGGNVKFPVSQSITYTGSPNGLSIGSRFGGFQAESVFVTGTTLSDSSTIIDGLTALDYGDAVILDVGCLISSAAILTSWSLSNVAVISGAAFSPHDMPDLTSLDLSSLVFCATDFFPHIMDSLETLDLSALTKVGGQFRPEDMSSLTALNADLLSSVVGNFAPRALPLLTALDFPALAIVGGDFGANELAGVTSMDFSALVTITGAMAPYEWTSIASVSFPALVSCGPINFQEFDALTSLSFASIHTFVGMFFTSGTNALTTLSINSGLLSVTDDISITSAALNQASVDALLVRLAALNGTGGTTSYNNHNITITGTSDTPGAAGLAAIVTLQAMGRDNTVTTN